MAAATRKKSTSTRKTTRNNADGKKTASSSGGEVLSAEKEFQDGVDLYESCLEALRGGDFAAAKKKLDAFLESYVREDMLRDRARMYLKVCESRIAAEAASADSSDDVYYLGLMHANNLDDEAALDLVRQSIAKDDGNDKAHYLLALILARVGERDEAVAALQKSIELNADNRLVALNDPDFEDFRAEPPFSDLLGAQSS